MDDHSLDRRTHNGRKLGVLLIVLLVALGSAAVSYNLGLTRGLAQAGVAAVTAPGAPPYYYGYYGPRPWGFGGFAPFFFVILLFVLFRGLLWRGPWHRGGRGGGLYFGGSRFDEWHRQAHERMKTDPPLAASGDANR
jgi:hypothetical protein